MKAILATKQYMTQIFDEKGRVSAVTILSVPGVTVTDVRTKERDGYEAVQVGFGTTKESRLTKAERGHLKDLSPMPTLREFRVQPGDLKRGDAVDLSVFAEGDVVTVSAISKAKGFQGGVKRHGFAGGPRTHGQKHSEREPGSIATGRIQTVRKGKKMAGRMGGERVTVKNLEVIRVDVDKKEIAIKGAIPGRRGTIIEVKGN